MTSKNLVIYWPELMKITPRESSRQHYSNDENIRLIQPKRTQIENEATEGPAVTKEETNNVISKIRELSCKFCAKQFRKEFNLAEHERCHTGEKPFVCQLCFKSFAQKSNMKKHCKRHRVWPSVMKTLPKNVTTHDTYSCQFCTETFSKYSFLKKHITSLHSERKVFKCLEENCLQQFASVSDLITHTTNHCKNLPAKCKTCSCILTAFTSGGNDQCKSCIGPLITNTKQKCAVCHSVFRSVVSLRRHLATENHCHICSICDSTFTAERYLRRHLASHNESRKCMICLKQLKSAKALQEHIALHIGDRKFVCEPCGATFVNHFRLKRHMAKHFGNTFHCPYRVSMNCQRNFNRKDKLQAHIKTHSLLKSRSLGKKLEKVPNETHLEIFQMSFFKKL